MFFEDIFLQLTINIKLGAEWALVLLSPEELKLRGLACTRQVKQYNLTKNTVFFLFLIRTWGTREKCRFWVQEPEKPSRPVALFVI